MSRFTLREPELVPSSAQTLRVTCEALWKRVKTAISSKQTAKKRYIGAAFPHKKKVEVWYSFGLLPIWARSSDCNSVMESRVS